MPPVPPQSLFGILGKPLVQSLSPILHTWGFARVSYAGAYFAWEKDADALPDFFHSVRNLPISGLSVTIPHKRAVLPFLDGLTERARVLGAVNTLFWRDGKLIGENTDVDGFLAPLTGRGQPLPPSALILGAGGACRAALAGLNEIGLTRVCVAARRLDKAAMLAHEFGCTVVPWEEREQALAAMGPCLVINATPLGMKGVSAGQSPLSKNVLTTLACWSGDAPSLVYDLVYAPRRTRLAQEAENLGLERVDGLAFFVAQGLMQFRIWTGLSLPFAAAFALVEQALAKQALAEKES